MKFGVLALDYDGTIAAPCGVHPEVRAVIGELRARGIAVILATGRILSDLRREVGDLRLFDAVVAENGAVLAFPDSGRSQVFGHPPPPVFLEALEREGLDWKAGECVLELPAEAASRVLPLIHMLELPLVLHFNRARMMVLPQAISKATGLREAATALRLSLHNTLAIGDAENDHEMLDACEIGAAVSWGSEALKGAADDVVEGGGPEAVAAYIRRAAGAARLRGRRAARRVLLLGRTEADTPLLLPVLGRNLLIAGDPRSGKSWVAGLLAEQLILQHYCVCVIDPEGDYRSLEALPGVVVLGGADPPPRLSDLTGALRYPDVSVVIDLSRQVAAAKRDLVRTLLVTLASMRRDTGLPHRIVVDEAHYFLHEAGVTDFLDLELAGYTLITYKASSLHPDVLASAGAVIVTCETHAPEVEALAAHCGSAAEAPAWRRVMADLRLDEAVLLPEPGEDAGPPPGERDMVRFRIAPRLTPHVRHRHKYLDVPVPEGCAFAFTHGGEPTGDRARTLREFAAIAATAASGILEGHLRRGDVSSWIANVFGDRTLAARICDLEAQVALGRMLDAADAVLELIQERYPMRDAVPA